MRSKKTIVSDIEYYKTKLIELEKELREDKSEHDRRMEKQADEIERDRRLL